MYTLRHTYTKTYTHEDKQTNKQKTNLEEEAIRVMGYQVMVSSRRSPARAT